MATVFEIVLEEPDGAYAAQGAAAALAELGWLEDHLSRFIETSDVARLSHLGPGAATPVDPSTWACLSVALEIHAATGGAFNPWNLQPSTTVPFALDSNACRVEVLQPCCLDLGGIGKGFALDWMAKILGDWHLTHALLWASTSTALALDPPRGQPGWEVRLEGHAGTEERAEPLLLARRAVAASGTSIQGQHVFDPRRQRFVARHARAWAAAPSAAQADALSTAFLVMDREEIRDCCRRLNGLPPDPATLDDLTLLSAPVPYAGLTLPAAWGSPLN